jgi:hypothetical protein
MKVWLADRWWTLTHVTTLGARAGWSQDAALTPRRGDVGRAARLTLMTVQAQEANPSSGGRGVRELR